MLDKKGVYLTLIVLLIISRLYPKRSRAHI